MPEHLKALIVILLAASAVFAFARAPACAAANSAADFERRRNLWFAITLVAFLAHNYWVFVVLAATAMLIAGAREPNRLALFLTVLLAVPPIEVRIPGFGLVEQLFALTYARLASLAILLPAFLWLRRQRGVEPFGRSSADKLLLAYLVLYFFLMFRASSFTNALRFGVFYSFVDVFLPYYVASRGLGDLRRFRDTIAAFALGMLIVAALAAFETAKGWLLYVPLDEALGVDWWSNYLNRGETLRAQVTGVQPVPMGFCLAVAIGLFLFLVRSLPRGAWLCGLGVLAAGSIATMSRGPWVGIAVMVGVFLLTGPAALSRLALASTLGVLCLPLLLTPLGERIIDHLPFIGDVGKASVVYRQRLFEISVGVIADRWLFGAFDYYLLPEMQPLKQGSAPIDIVNTYLQVALERGLAGLSLFVGFFLVVMRGVYRALRRLDDPSDERYVLGQALLATLAGILVTIVTLSSMAFVPWLYWIVAGMAVAYARMLAPAAAPTRAPVPGVLAGAGR